MKGTSASRGRRRSVREPGTAHRAPGGSPAAGAKGRGHHRVRGLSAPSEPPHPSGAPTLPGHPLPCSFPGWGRPERALEAPSPARLGVHKVLAFWGHLEMSWGATGRAPWWWLCVRGAAVGAFLPEQDWALGSHSRAWLAHSPASPQPPGHLSTIPGVQGRCHRPGSPGQCPAAVTTNCHKLV